MKTALRWILPTLFLSSCMMLFLCPLLQASTEGLGKRNLRVAFFYNPAMFADSTLRNLTANILNESNGVDLVTFEYRDSNAFCDIYRKHFSSSVSEFDLILGPSDSDSLKALDKTLPKKASVPFLAPFVTTSPGAYPYLTLISASPTDAKRVTEAYQSFVQYTALTALGCLHSDDPWGQGIVRDFRTVTATAKITINSQPVIESSLDGETNTRIHNDNGQAYDSFLDAMRKQGATVIVVALLESKSVNDFLASLRKLDNNSFVRYKPSILLLNPPSFDASHAGRGVLTDYLKDYDILFVQDHVLTNSPSDAQRTILAHLDACRVIAASAANWPPSRNDGSGATEAVHQIANFYASNWHDGLADEIAPSLVTGFHRAKLLLGDPELDVVQAKLQHGNVTATVAEDLSRRPYLWKLWYAAAFFLRHHRSLWHPFTVVPFLMVCFASLLYMVRSKALRAPWLILRTRAFWVLFIFNAFLTYTGWVLSIQLGIFDDNNLVAAILLASVCPTAANAVGDLAKRFLPFNLTGVIRVIEELNGALMNDIGEDRTREYESKLQGCSLEELKRKFFEVLFLDTDSDALRNRLREQLQSTIKQITDVDPNGDATDAIKKVYAHYVLRMVCYLSTSEHDMAARLSRMFGGINLGK